MSKKSSKIAQNLEPGARFFHFLTDPNWPQILPFHHLLNFFPTNHVFPSTLFSLLSQFFYFKLVLHSLLDLFFSYNFLFISIIFSFHLLILCHSHKMTFTLLCSLKPVHSLLSCISTMFIICLLLRTLSLFFNPSSLTYSHDFSPSILSILDYF